ncbi:glycine zipper 2TM domain-containing protein [Altererythrobacter sp. CC-YST694]|uniref:glycine zipper 2TM domain-containing protein n=1 Tax=Altererythrobacter sp. CC-YST694 TaxID=2755038 RepID=UPI001D024D29|nr:glycine zipper 2TM domain-containing protein [Altererythrobacter sp. CC-YST694]MCB5424194.1 glycine zipper 2TM domain-containing protein [Altererythrobacter sp. CC-YST694]
MKKFMMAIAAAGLVLPAVPAAAHERGRDHYHSHRHDDRSMYDSRGRYKEPRRISHNDRVWRGNDGRYYCKRDNGTTGLIIGAAGGALVGRAIDTRGDRAVGTILGAAVGGLLGREIDRGEARCR